MADSQPQSARLKVFVSYSRVDLAFAHQLVAGLSAVGVAASIDQQGIHGGERWRERLGGLIREADSIVFVLSGASAASEICRWELEESLALGKRILPVLPAPLGEIEPPEQLAALNYIFFYDEPNAPGSGFGEGLARLSAALLVDIEWLREHTRVAELARRWREGGEPADLLVRGSEFARLMRWRDERPSDAPPLTVQQRAFFQASEDAEAERQNAERKRLAEIAAAQEARAAALARLSRRTRIGLLAMAALALVVGGFAWFSYEQNRQLQHAALRLAASMKLRVADTDHRFDADKAWIRVATDLKLALGAVYGVDPRRGPQRLGSGFLAYGDALHPSLKGEVLFLTAGHVLRAPGAPPPPLEALSVVFPAVDGEAAHRFADVVVFDQSADLAVLRLSAPPPRATYAIDLSAEAERARNVDGVAVLFVGPEDEGFFLGVGHRIAPVARFDRDNRLFYTYVTEIGASGGPVLDLNTGKLVCLHLGGVRNERALRDGEQPFGFCLDFEQVAARVGRSLAAE